MKFNTKLNSGKQEFWIYDFLLYLSIDILSLFQVFFISGYCIPARIYFFKVNNENTRAMCEIC